MEIDDSGPVRMGKMDFGGVIKSICLSLLPELGVGNYAIVHVGVAISQIDEETARQTLSDIAQLMALEEDEHLRGELNRDTNDDSQERPTVS